MRIVVTGTSGGIGRAVRDGAAEEREVRLADAARAAGHEVTEINRADFGRGGPLVGSGGVDGVVFATGTCPVAPVSKTDDALLAGTFAVNCGLFVRLVRELAAEGGFSSSGARIVSHCSNVDTFSPPNVVISSGTFSG